MCIESCVLSLWEGLAAAPPGPAAEPSLTVSGPAWTAATDKDGEVPCLSQAGGPCGAFAPDASGDREAPLGLGATGTGSF